MRPKCGDHAVDKKPRGRMTIRSRPRKLDQNCSRTADILNLAQHVMSDVQEHLNTLGLA